MVPFLSFLDDITDGRTLEIARNEGVPRGKKRERLQY